MYNKTNSFSGKKLVLINDFFSKEIVTSLENCPVLSFFSSHAVHADTFLKTILLKYIVDGNGMYIQNYRWKLRPGHWQKSLPDFGRHTFVSWSKGSLASPGACVLWGWLWLPQCFLQLLDRKLRFVCSGINKATSRASSTEQAPKRKGGPGMMEFCSKWCCGLVFVPKSVPVIGSSLSSTWNM